MDELPIGFGMALLQNPKATEYFNSCTAPQKDAIVQKAQQMQTKQDMHAFVNTLPTAAL